MTATSKKKTPRCEGWRRYGGAFTLGPVKWVQCPESATVMLTVKQEGEKKKQRMPSCQKCWLEACSTKGIAVLDAKPIAVDVEKKR